MCVLRYKTPQNSYKKNHFFFLCISGTKFIAEHEFKNHFYKFDLVIEIYNVPFVWVNLVCLATLIATGF